MQNIPAMLDALFASPEAERPAQQPSVAFQEREKALAERANKIEALRQVRLVSGAETPVSFVYEVVRHRGHWRVLHCRKHSTPCSDQAAAILAAKKLARKKRDLGHSAEVILQRTDGQSVPQELDDDQEVTSSQDT